MRSTLYLCWKSREGIVVWSPNHAEVELCVDGLRERYKMTD